MRYLVTLLILFFVVLSSGCDPEEFEVCGDLVEHDGYAYSTVQIGDQCWFAENCRYLPTVSPSSGGSYTESYYYVHGYEGTDVAAAKAIENYETFGVLYNWPAVMTEGICPSGWHIPSYDEFTQLTDFLGGEFVAGGKMKEAGNDHWNEPNVGATNSSGFTGLPGGSRNDGGVYGTGSFGFSWTSSEADMQPESESKKFLLYYNHENITGGQSYKSDGYSARCVRD